MPSPHSSEPTDLVTPLCDWCMKRTGTHEQPVLYWDMGRARVEKMHICGDCLSEDTWWMTRRYSFVPGQGWTI